MKIITPILLFLLILQSSLTLAATTQATDSTQIIPVTLKPAPNSYFLTGSFTVGGLSVALNTSALCAQNYRPLLLLTPSIIGGDFAPDKIYLYQLTNCVKSTTQYTLSVRSQWQGTNSGTQNLYPMAFTWEIVCMPSTISLLPGC